LGTGLVAINQGGDMLSKITQNFFYNEFRPAGAPVTWMPISDYQNILITMLANNLQIVRSSMPPGSTMTISCGVRVLSDFNRLVSQGYHPSPTSDHFCGNAVPVDSISDKFKRYGPVYYFSVGAADIIPNGMDNDLLFRMAVQMTLRGVCRFGQIINEQDIKKGTKWVHFSNDYSSIFSSDMVKFLNKQPFLTTIDGGLTYTPYLPV